MGHCVPAGSGGSPLQRIRNTYRDFLKIPEDELWSADALVATVMATKMHRQDEPICMILVAPSGWGKTELIRPILQWPGIGVDYSTQTAQALASGAPGAAKSLLHRLDRRLLLIKDMTALMSSVEVRTIFFSTIRDAYDGQFDKHSGATDQGIHAKMRFCIFAGMVNKIWTILENDQDLGYRYLLIRYRHSFPRDAQKAIQNQICAGYAKRGVWRDSIKSHVRSALDDLRAHYAHGQVAPPTQDPYEPTATFELRQALYNEEVATGWHRVQWPEITLTPAFNTWVMAASRLLTATRVGSSNKIKSEEDTPSYTGPTELAASFRAQKQLIQIIHMRTLADFRTATDDSDIRFGRAILRDTITPIRYLMFQAVAKAGDYGIEKGALARRIRRPAAYVEQICEHLGRVGVLNVTEAGLVSLAPDTKEDIRDSWIFEGEL